MDAAVYVQTNDDAGNEIVAFRRADDGALAPLGRYSTGGRGTGAPHLPSQSSVVVSVDGRWLLVVNPGSDELSVFAVEPDGLRLTDRVASGGTRPTSVAVRGALVYVLNNGTPSISGFNLVDGKLTALAESTRSLSAEDADPAQISFTADGHALIVTERGTNSISSFVVDDHGYAEGPRTIRSSGQTPYGFDFTPGGSLIVTEAFGGTVGAAAASSYTVTGMGELMPVSGSVGDKRSEVCWAAVTNDGRFAFVTNFGDGTVSSYAIGPDGSLTLREPVAGATRHGRKGVRDEAISSDGRYLYAIDADAQKVFGWAVGQGGELTPVGEFDGVPDTVAGLAAS
ncbi:MAG TPA: beta-propeller fold lactonase family protein [Solirubrobacteraceae bacterium]|nr:beta-propeller fold lactonase family protein [Solirubrobacteraceae bacterium]